MKHLTVTTLAALLLAFAAHGQGTVNFSNIGAGAKVTNGMTGAIVPAGAAFMAGLYFAPDGTTGEGQFMLLGNAVALGPTAGTYSGGARTAPTANAGGFGHFQVRVWESAFGTSYEAALGRGLTGTSGILRVDTGDPTTVPPGTAAALSSSTTVSGRSYAAGIILVPEPSTYALGLLGLGLVALLRRKRS